MSIVGYVGRREATPILLEALRLLEYRGFASAGLAVQNGGGIATWKSAGRVSALADLVARDQAHGTCGIAGAHWATALPTQPPPPGTLALVQSGFLENAAALRTRLARAGHELATDANDTVTLARLIEGAPGAALEERVIAALADVEGRYGLAVMAAGEPHKIVVARRGSPVLLGIGNGEQFVASDASALLGYTRSVVYLAEGEVAVLTPAGHRVLDRDARLHERAADDLDWDAEMLTLGYSAE